MTRDTTPQVRSAAIAFIFVTVVLDVVSMGIIIPVLPKLVEGVMGGDTARAFLQNIFEASPTDFVRATMRVYHAPARASRIEVLVLP